MTFYLLRFAVPFGLLVKVSLAFVCLHTEQD
jgi:hypothetical protein